MIPVQPAALPDLIRLGSRARREEAARAADTLRREMRALARWVKRNLATIDGNLWFGIYEAVMDAARDLRLVLADRFNLRPDRIDVRPAMGFIPGSDGVTGFTIVIFHDWKEARRFDDRYFVKA